MQSPYRIFVVAFVSLFAASWLQTTTAWGQGGQETEEVHSAHERHSNTRFRVSDFEGKPVDTLAAFPRLQNAFPTKVFRFDFVATVNNWDPIWNQLFVQQNGEALFLHLPYGFYKDPPDIKLGSKVRAVGLFYCDSYRLMVDQLTIVEDGDPVEPLELDLADLNPSDHWSKRISTQGTVESVLIEQKRCQIMMRSGTRRFLARFAHSFTPQEAFELIGDTVAFDGTLAYLEDEIDRQVAFITHSMESEKFEIVKEGESAFDDSEPVDLGQPLAKLPERKLAQLFGQLSYIREYDQLVLEDEQGNATTVYACFEGDIKLGDYLRVYATPIEKDKLPETPEFAIGLDNAGEDSAWRAQVIERINPSFLDKLLYSAEEIEKENIHLRRGTVSGYLQSFSSSKKLTHQVTLKSGPYDFTASFRAKDVDFKEFDFDTANEVSFTGLILQPTADDSAFDFELQVASVKDIEVVSRHIEIYPRYVYWIVGGLLGLVLTSAFFVWRLRGQVGEQSEDMARLIGRLNATYDAVREGLLVIDNHGSVLTTNAQFQELLGLDAETIGPIEDAEPSWFAQQIANQFQSSDSFLDAWQETQIRPDATLTLELMTTDPQPRTLVVFTAPVQTVGGSAGTERFENRIWTFDDISHRKQLEADLIQSQKMEAVGRLAGGVAHDFNNLLLAITANLELARMQPADGKKMDYLEAAEKAVDRASKLVKHLLGFSRKSVLELRVRDPHEVIERIQNLLERILNASINLKVNLAQDIWNVKMDDTHIEQVILNLCLNARDACIGNEGLIQISTSNVPKSEVKSLMAKGEIPMVRERDYVRIVVEDNGSGIQDDILEKVFDPFFTTKELGKGTGLGLSMSLGIVEQHEGMIHLNSKPGEGTRCDLLLPRTMEPINLADSKIGRLVQSDTKFAHILLADDDELVRTSTANALRVNGYEVTSVGNGVDTLIHLRSSDKFAVAVIDFSMPGMATVDLFRKIRESRPTLPIIITSGYSLEINSIEEQLRQPMAFIAKPYRTPTLVQKINQHIQDSELSV